jgi:hypothetical protein
VARAILKYTFAALLALLSTQAVTPHTRVCASIEVVCSKQAEEHAPRRAQSSGMAAPIRQNACCYVSRTRPEPAAAVLFQRPPPSFFFS